ncbi:MAG: hypothetical protein MJB57_13190 [Gemmatimonadetes bacterium]|nr:hypothetical protein [Gemmatimonadota bacterium]
MEQMLAHPDWVWSHSVLLAGYFAVLVGLVLFRRGAGLPAGTKRWSRFALVGTGLQVVEMVLHTAAAVDHARLVAGEATPVLTTHLAATVLFYPIFAATFIGFIVVAAKERQMGSWWIAWLGVLGLAAHGLAAVLVVALDIEAASVLFPGVMGFAIWAITAAAWRRGGMSADVNVSDTAIA